MSERLIIAIAALFLTAAAQPSKIGQASIADQNAAAAQQAFDSQLSAAASFMRDNNMSAHGVSTVLAGMRSEQHEQWRIFQEGAEQQQAIRAAADAEPFNAAHFEAALKRYRDNDSSAVLSAVDAEIKILRSLSPQDQRVFARLMHTSSTARLGIPARPLKGGN
jgi:hypothetical protein